jgi:ornithine cyclodeaminase
VGSSVRTTRELDAQAVARSRFFVDRRESALNESGDFLLAKAEGAVEDEHIAGELGDALIGTVDGRRNPDEVTVFESLGLGVEDVAAAHLVYERALEKGAFTPFELGGVRV